MSVKKYLSSLGIPWSDSDDEEGIEGKNIFKYMNQCVFLAEWNLFYQLLCWYLNRYFDGLYQICTLGQLYPSTHY